MNSPPSPPTYSPPPFEVQPPPRKRHTARNVLLIIGGAFTVLIVLIVIIAVATGGTKIKPVAAPSTSAPATSAPATSAPTPTPTPSLATEPVGESFSVTGPNGPSGATTVYNVTLDKVDQHAALGAYEDLTNGNDHVTAAEFTIAGQSGQSSDDADSDAVAVGSDGQDYTAAFDTVTDGTNFQSGEFNVAAGQTVNGWVSFELPAGVTIASVQWSPGFSGQAATWNV
jgi:hypothetical protein